MRVEDFKKSPVGSLVEVSLDQRSAGHFAFLPNPLPSTLTLSLQTTKLLSEAAYAVGALNARISFLPNPEILIQPSLSREALSTSAIEGTMATLNEVVAASNLAAASQSREVREVRNYITAALWCYESLKTLPISRRMLEHAQRMLVADTRGDSYDAGMLRQRLVAIGKAGSSLADARYVPPPPGPLLEEAFTAWEKWIHEPSEFPLIAKLALSHYQFEAVHPFSDGNGRLGRLLVTLQLVDSGALARPVLNLSEWFEHNQDRYRDGLLNLSLTGDFDAWIQLFAEAVRDQAAKTESSIVEILNYRKLLTQVKGVSNEVADFIVSKVGFMIGELAEYAGVAYGTAKTIAESLIEENLLLAYSKGKHRVFYAQRIEDILV